LPAIDILNEVKILRTPRVQQLEAMFDVPASEATRFELSGEFPYETSGDWQVGLIVGPSGCGKSTILKKCFGEEHKLRWNKPSVIDDFDQALSMQDISEVCQSVGFNTIPAWLRPFNVLSNGEKFRVQMARLLLEGGEIVCVDEFTSVVDRQVAQIGAHAVQKFIRKTKKKFVAASCHFDIIDWLQPDWVLEPGTMRFQRRSLQRRPSIDLEIRRVPYEYWRLFAPYHYLTADLNKSAACFCLFAKGLPASFGGTLHRPHATAHDIRGLSRLVTLPDWQGLGLAMILAETLGAAYAAIGKRFHTYPAHPSLIRSFAHSDSWAMRKRPGVFSPQPGRTTGIGSTGKGFGGRPCAVFEFTGKAMNKSTATKLIESKP
jgi:ABC-type ATPase involved in cell division